LAAGSSGARCAVAQERALTATTHEFEHLDNKDATSILQKSLNEAAKKGSKGLVLLPAGRFRIQPLPNENSALVLPSGIRFQGAGRDKTILSMAENAFGHLINAPYGNVEIADLTIDGNAPNRPGQVGHNLRVEGDNISIQDLKLINSASYGLGIGQRRFARNVLVQNVEIESAGADGIDIKNKLGRTENVRLDSVHVRGFARRLSRGQAGIDLRGECRLENIQIAEVPLGCDGLRFRHGVAGQDNGPGAHGSRAVGVSVSGAGTGIAVVARDVELTDISLTRMHIGLFIGDDNLVVHRGAFKNSNRAAIRTRATRYSRPTQANFYACSMRAERSVIFEDIDRITFHDTRFEACESTELMRQLTKNPRVVFERCLFDASCKYPTE
jgi:hypothetical protein